MQRTTTSISSTAVTMITGMWRNASVAFSHSSTWIPSMPGIMMSSSTTSTGLARSSRMASPPSAACST